MVRVKPAEALALLNNRQICPDMTDWRPERQSSDTWLSESGVVTIEGVRTRLWVQLLFRRTQKTRKIWYKFSVHLRHAWGTQGVYQLDVAQYQKLPKNLHDLPHEHMGDTRKVGTQGWCAWTFDETIRHFSERTNIEFEPPVMNPESFELRG